MEFDNRSPEIMRSLYDLGPNLVCQFEVVTTPKEEAFWGNRIPFHCFEPVGFSFASMPGE